MSDIDFETNDAEIATDFLSDIELTLPKMDEPIADPGFLAIYQAVKFSREHVNMLKFSSCLQVKRTHLIIKSFGFSRYEIFNTR